MSAIYTSVSLPYITLSALQGYGNPNISFIPKKKFQVLADQSDPDWNITANLFVLLAKSFKGSLIREIKRTYKKIMYISVETNENSDPL